MYVQGNRKVCKGQLQPNGPDLQVLSHAQLAGPLRSLFMKVLGNGIEYNGSLDESLTVITVLQYGYPFQAFSWNSSEPAGAIHRTKFGTLLNRKEKETHC